MHLSELKAKTPGDLLAFAESLQIENASSLRKQDIMFAILKTLAENEQAIYGDGTLEILPDGFGFLRSPQANFLPGPDDIYVSPAQVRRFGLRTGDTVEGQIRAPKDGSATSRCSRSTRSTSSRRNPSAPGSTSTTSPRSTRRGG
jgi:transcription termination factor Rho